MQLASSRTRWAAIGAAVAVSLGAGGLGISHATSPSNAAALVPITPCRIVDTRPAPDTVGTKTSPLGPGETLIVTAHGSNGSCTNASAIPTSATGLQLNVTALGATASTFVTVWPFGATQPTASNLNPVPGGGPVPNAVTTGLSPDGKFNVFNGFGSVNVIIDVVGYYTDHNHDDRYDTKAQIDSRFTSPVDLQIGAASFVPDGDTTSWLSGCARQVAAPRQIRASVELPRGATIVSITGYFQDSTGVATLELMRTNQFYVAVATVGSGTTDTLVNLTAAPTSPVIVGAADYFVLQYTAPGPGHALCGASIRYIMSGVGAAAADVAGVATADATPTGQG